MKAYLIQKWREECQGATFLRECAVELVLYGVQAVLFVIWLGGMVGLFMMHA